MDRVIPDMQDSITERQFESGRISHAYIFDAENESISFSESMSFAAKLLGVEEQRLERCPDFKLVKPTGNYITIDSIREVLTYLETGPYNSNYKVVLLSEAHKLRLESSNALLKTMEEMPEYGKLLLSVSGCEKLLPTIRSRCQLIVLSHRKEYETDFDRDILKDAIDDILKRGSISLYDKRKYFDEFKNCSREFYKVVIEYLGELLRAYYNSCKVSDRASRLVETGHIDIQNLQKALEIAMENESLLSVNLNFFLSIERLVFALDRRH